MRLIVLTAGWLSAAAAAPTPASADDARTHALARSRGCYLCHSQEDRPGAAPRLPLAPSWRAIAQEYRGKADAEERLARIVLSGMGPRPGDEHWRGKVALADMPPNDYHLTALEAREIVRWLLRH